MHLIRLLVPQRRKVSRRHLNHTPRSRQYRMGKRLPLSSSRAISPRVADDLPANLGRSTTGIANGAGGRQAPDRLHPGHFGSSGGLSPSSATKAATRS